METVAHGSPSFHDSSAPIAMTHDGVLAPVVDAPPGEERAGGEGQREGGEESVAPPAAHSARRQQREQLQIRPLHLQHQEEAWEQELPSCERSSVNGN